MSKFPFIPVRLSVAIALLCGGVCATAETTAATNMPMMAKGLEVEENVNRTVDLNLSFLAEDGSEKKLSEYFRKGRPVVVNLVYYACPTLCNLVLNGQAQTLKELPWTPGTEYEIVTISIDPRETPEQASRKKAAYIANFKRPAPGWHFLSDTQGHAKVLANQLGFKYRFDEGRNQFVHPAAIMILTPEGKIARYLYGTRFRAFDVRMGVTEASEGKGRFSVERVLLKLCYQYDPKSKTYVALAQNLMQGAAGMTVMVFGIAIWRFWTWEKQRIDKKRAEDPEYDR